MPKKSFIISFIKSIIINFLIILSFAGFFPKFLDVENVKYVFFGAFIITLFYKFVRPVLLMISILPIIMTFGIFLVVINALLIELTSEILKPHFNISSFSAALLLAIFISIFNFIFNENKTIIIKKIN